MGIGLSSKVSGMKAFLLVPSDMPGRPEPDLPNEGETLRSNADAMTEKRDGQDDRVHDSDPSSNIFVDLQCATVRSATAC